MTHRSNWLIDADVPVQKAALRLSLDAGHIRRYLSERTHMRTFLAVIVLVVLTACSQEELLQKFSSPADQATAKSYIDHLRARSFDQIEKAMDSSIRTADIRDRLETMADLIPNQDPSSVKVVGAQSFSAHDAKTVNTTFEYNFGGKWLLANVAVRGKQGTKTIVGFNVNPMPQSLEAQNRFSLVGKSANHYMLVTAAIGAALLTLYALVICVKTKFPKRKWLWVLFILVGFGKLAINWTTGEWSFAPLSVQLFSAAAMAPLYGPWTVAVSLPLGAIVFLVLKRSRLERTLSANSTAESDARNDDARGSP